MRTSLSVRQSYDRIARFYDWLANLTEGKRGNGWRKLLWGEVHGSRVLEVGVGTGSNFPHYSPEAKVVAIDLSPRMLERGEIKAKRNLIPVALCLMDVERLGCRRELFDFAVASFVFCSVADPVAGLREVGRVLKTGGRVILLEHTISANPILKRVMNFVNPLVVRLWGANINRDTEANIIASGLKIERVTNLFGGVVKLIEARK